MELYKVLVSRVDNYTGKVTFKYVNIIAAGVGSGEAVGYRECSGTSRYI